MSSVELQNLNTSEELQSNDSDSWSFRSLAIVCGTFLLALSIRLWYAFFDGHETIVFSCDASEYLRAAQTLAEVTSETSSQWTDIAYYCLGVLPEAQVAHLHETFAPLYELLHRAGPTFPLFLYASYAITGNPISPEYFYAPVVFHCIFTSGTCGLIAYVGTKIWNRTAGISAGVLSAIYPGFIVNSLRLYSESFAAFWLMAVVALLVHMHITRKWKLSVLLGFCLGILQITRSALVLVTTVTFAFLAGFSGKGNWKKNIPLTIIGLALAMLPLMVVQNLTMGSSSFVQDRLGHYNMFVGLDVNSQGWLSYPYPDGRGIEEKSFLQLMKQRYEESHSRFVKLLMDKPARLLKFPWNDFRTPISIFGENSQVLLHQICLALAAIGISSALFLKQTDQDNRRIYFRLFLFLLLGIHAAYFFFITVPRYALTAMPLILLFAGAGFYQTKAAIANKNSRLTGISMVFSLGICFALTRLELLPLFFQWLGFSPDKMPIYLTLITVLNFLTLGVFFLLLYLSCASERLSKFSTVVVALAVIPFVALPLRAHTRFTEWRAPVEADFSLEQKIILPKDKESELTKRQCFLLVDCNDWKTLGQSTILKLNGQNFKAKFLPIMPYSQDLNAPKQRGEEQTFYECEDIYKSVVAAAGGTNLDIRQWFILPLPLNIISQSYSKPDHSLTVDVAAKPNHKAVFYGTYPSKRKAGSEDYWQPSIARYSWEKFLYGVENEYGFTDSRFDEKYSVLGQADDKKDLSKAKGLQAGKYNIRLLVAKGQELDYSHTTSITSNTTRAPFQGTVSKVSINELPTYHSDSLWQVTYTGRLSSDIELPVQIPVNVSARVSSKPDSNNKQKTYLSPWVPSSINLVKGENEFSFSFPIKPAALKNPEKIEVAISRGGVADSNQYFGVFYSPENKISDMPRKELEQLLKTQVQWLGNKLEITALNQYPTGIGYEIF